MLISNFIPVWSYGIKIIRSIFLFLFCFLNVSQRLVDYQEECFWLFLSGWTDYRCLLSPFDLECHLMFLCWTFLGGVWMSNLLAQKVYRNSPLLLHVSTCTFASNSVCFIKPGATQTGKRDQWLRPLFFLTEVLESILITDMMAYSQLLLQFQGSSTLSWPL